MGYNRNYNINSHFHEVLKSCMLAMIIKQTDGNIEVTISYFWKNINFEKKETMCKKSVTLDPFLFSIYFRLESDGNILLDF